MGRTTVEHLHLGTGLDASRNVARRLAALLLRRLLQLYWLTCLAIVAMGLNQMYPEVAAKVAYAFRDPALDLEKPFSDCGQAHYAGYFNIPRASAGYLESQDEDKNGRACEPYPGYPPDYLARLRLIEHRLMLVGAGGDSRGTGIETFRTAAP